MNSLIVLTAVFAAACAAPADYAAIAPAAIAAAPVAVAHAAPVAVAHAAPVAVAHAAPVAAAVPAPYTTSQQGPATTTIEQAPAVVTKQLHFGKTQFVSGYSAGIHKPAIPDFNIAVPTVLKGSVAYNAPVVKQVTETHVVNEPVPVERPYNAPYDVPVYKEVVHEVPVPYHVDAPYEVPHPVPVAGEPIVNVRQGAPVVHRTHSVEHAAPVVAHAAYATHGLVGAVAAPAAAALVH